MKKLAFAAIAALVMVSVSNIFAANSAASVSNVIPDDTTTVDTVATPVEQPSQKKDSTTLDTDTSANTATAPTAVAML